MYVASAGISPDAICATHRAASGAPAKCISLKRWSVGLGTPLERSSFLSGRHIQCRRLAQLITPCRRRTFITSSVAASKTQNPFSFTRELDGLSKILVELPKAALYAGMVVFLAVTGAVGAYAGSRAPVSARNVGKIAGAAAGVVAGAAAVSQLQAKRLDAAGVLLNNSLAERADPSTIRRDEVEAIGDKVGANLSVKLVDELKRLYDTYLESTIPPGDNPLKGDEAEKIRAFKDALGLSDEDATPVHIDVGRRIMRSRFEASSRTGSSEQFKALQKLIYVSELVFGVQKAAFLLPWRRVFNLSDSSLMVAKRDNAKALFRAHIESKGGKLQSNRAALAELKAFQEKVRLEDEIAQEAVKEAARARVEDLLDRGIECIKRRTRVRDYSDAVKAVKEVLAYSRALASLANDPTLPKGLGPVSIYGGRLESAGRDLRELYRIYLEESLSGSGAFTDALEDDMADLQQILALGVREAEDLRSEIVSKTYKRLLREDFRSGRLDAAPSKAEVLGELCDRLNFDQDAAAQLHKQLYREKLASVVEDKKITDDEAAELDRLRRLLCIPKSDIQELHKQICGRIYTEIVEDAMKAGIDRFGFAERQNVERTQNDLRIDSATAKEVLEAVARRAFLAFITRSRTKSNRLDAAKELKALVFFSNIVVTPLLEDLKKEETDAQKKKQAEAEEAQKKLADLIVEAQSKMEKEKAGGAAESSESTTQEEKIAEADEHIAEEEQPQASAAPSEGEEAAEKPSAEEAAAAAAKQEEEDERVATLRKSQDAAKEREAGEEVGSTGVTMRSQREITLKNDLDARERLDIYRNFLLYCMSGDVVALPMGSTVVVERDSSEFARLSQLGDILGLGPLEISQVHTGLAEQAYRSQVQQAIGSGDLSKEKAEFLAEIRDKMGLSKEAAEKIIKGVQNQHVISNLQAAKATGTLSLQKVLDMKDAGVEVESFVSEDMRLQLYTKEVADVLSGGTGEFDEERLLRELPESLALPERRVRSAIEAQAGDRKRNVLVQAVSQLRQRKLDDAVKSLNNLLACNKALPSEKQLEWREKEELQDLFSVYVSREKSEEKEGAVAKILGISDGEAATLKELVQSGQFKLEQEVEDDSFF